MAVSSARVAEAAKLTENIFRGANIALVNELKIIYDAMRIDVWDVLDAAATKPFGFMKFTPGPGLGGHCIAQDPFYLTWKAREFGLSTRFIELAGEVNVSMAEYVVGKLQAALNRQGKRRKAAECSCWASPARRSSTTPERVRPSRHIAVAPRMRSWPDLPELPSVALTPELLGSVDAAVITTDHSAADYEFVARCARLIIDMRGVYRTPRGKVIKA